ncbi:MAG TPA: gamma-glutamylcyclotransferase family protein [Polyangiaceae bacterium]|nr:gamma-glutamylcyclotransferase family protein [Polyangiaceae bacterium]
MAKSAHDPEGYLLFVYGSLKRGQSNHQELAAGQFVSTARTAPRFALRIISGYPALVPGTSAILGELYRLDAGALAGLDEFEGSAYVRKEIELADGERALVYLASVPDAGVHHPGDEWPAPGA